MPPRAQAGGIPQLRQLCDEIGIDVPSPVKMSANLLRNSSAAAADDAKIPGAEVPNNSRNQQGEHHGEAGGAAG
jgi:hypothetical protein